MTLEANVFCPCFQLGHAKAHPLAKDVFVHESGELLLISNDSDEISIHEKWLQDACPHPRQRVEARTAWIQVSGLRSLLNTVGGGNFPVLLKELPVTNDGEIPAENVRPALDELCRLRAVLAQSSRSDKMHVENSLLMPDQGLMIFLEGLEKVFKAAARWRRPVIWT